MNTIKSVYKNNSSLSVILPLYTARVPAGFPSAAEDFEDDKIDLNRYLIKHPAATFLVRVKGHSMRNCGISDGDLLVVDRSLDPKDGCIVVAILDGAFTVKRVHLINKALYLIPENPDFKPIRITSGMEFEIWGVVAHVIKDLS